ncbi:MAG: Gfo/Idh/MocA family oxidoreductase [Terracidiphilus sp.]|jgi:predicted dehydrogenase
MIRVGLVGFGLGGRVFHAPLISSVDGLELAAVVERSTNLAAECYPGISTYRSLDELLADSSIDLAVISTPSGTHFEFASKVIEAGKNLVVDKPMAVSSAEIARLMALAAARGVLLIPFHNRRWDRDFQTVQKLIQEGTLGRIVHLESTFDRWNPGSARRPWKDDPAQGGGILLDLGTHLADQALVLFAKPEAVTAEIVRERDEAESNGADDSFTLCLRYPGLSVTLTSNCLSALARPRFHLRGTKGNFRKKGFDPQEAALSRVTRIGEGPLGDEPVARWGLLSVDVDGGLVTHPVAPVPGDYRLFYGGVRDALLNKTPPPVAAVEAWRVARLLEWARESSAQRREIACDWSKEHEEPLA